MSEYVFRYASGYGCDMSALMDSGRVTVGDYFASDATDHYGTLHEEIVRCRDCKHFGTRNGLGLCKRWSYFSICSQPDDFCSRAERRDA